MSDSCRKCRREIPVEEHHKIPKFTFSNFKEIEYKAGKVLLCKECHNLIMGLTASEIFWKFVPKEKRKECRKFILEYTNRWLKKTII